MFICKKKSLGKSLGTSLETLILQLLLEITWEPPTFSPQLRRLLQSEQLLVVAAIHFHLLLHQLLATGDTFSHQRMGILVAYYILLL